MPCAGPRLSHSEYDRSPAAAILDRAAIFDRADILDRADTLDGRWHAMVVRGIHSL